MRFRKWFEMSSLRDMLSKVPQSPKWHPEGSVFAHTRLVRKALENAIALYQSYAPIAGIFGPVNDEDRTILRLAAWLHDTGKTSASAWTHPDGSQTPYTEFPDRNVNQMMSPDFGEPGGKWQSIGHEEPQHYEPQIQKLGSQWQQVLQNLSPQGQELLWYLVQRHMDFGDDGFHKILMNQMFDAQGNVLPERRFKLLIVFKLMDIMGRQGGDPRAIQLLKSIETVIAEKKGWAARQAARRGPEDREGFTRWLQAKGLPEDQIAAILQNKFGDT